MKGRHALMASVVVLATLVGAVAASASPRLHRLAWADTGVLPLVGSQEGEAYVAATGGEEDARAFLQIVPVSPFGTTTTLHLTESPGSTVPQAATLVACALDAPIPTEGRLEPEQAPAVDCTVRASGRRDAEAHAWVVDLDVFAETWATKNHGLALLPDPEDQTGTFRVAFESAGIHVVVASGPDADPDPAPGPVATSRGDTPALKPPPPPHDEAWQLPPLRAMLPAPAPADVHDPPITLPDAEDQAVDAPNIAVVGVANESRDASRPGAVPILLVLGLAGGLVAWRLSRPRPAPARFSSFASTAKWLLVPVALLPLLFSEGTIYKCGLILIFLVAAIGMHLLVNWAGELSLAHAAMVGVPAIAAASLSANSGISPILLIPLAVALGAALGALVGLPVLRTRGLQVALITLIAGIAAERFFFEQQWLVAAAGDKGAATARVGPWEFTSSASLYPLLLLAVIVVAAGTGRLMNSKVARGWFWIREDPRAAAAYGVPVARYRMFAFAAGGAYAGLAGGLSAAWVQHLTAQAFPSHLSFTYLAAAVLAGPGSIGGVVAATGLVGGGQLISADFAQVMVFISPIGLMVVMVRHQAGLNGIGRHIMRKISARQAVRRDGDAMLLSAGAAITVVGLAAIFLGWYHLGNTDQVWVQNQEMMSGGIGGLALVLVGLGLAVTGAVRRSLATTLQQRTMPGPDVERPTDDLAVPLDPEVEGVLVATGAAVGGSARRTPSQRAKT